MEEIEGISMEKQRFQELDAAMLSLIGDFCLNDEGSLDDRAVAIELWRLLNNRTIEVDGCMIYVRNHENIEGSLYVVEGRDRLRFRWVGDRITYLNDFPIMGRSEKSFVRAAELLKKGIDIFTSELMVMQDKLRFLKSEYEGDLEYNQEILLLLLELRNSLRRIDMFALQSNLEGEVDDRYNFLKILREFEGRLDMVVDIEMTFSEDAAGVFLKQLREIEVLLREIHDQPGAYQALFHIFLKTVLRIDLSPNQERFSVLIREIAIARTDLAVVTDPDQEGLINDPYLAKVYEYLMGVKTSS